jgi:hypothetical protein
VSPRGSGQWLDIGLGTAASLHSPKFPYTFSTLATLFPFQHSHDTASTILIPPPIHNAAGIPALDFWSQAPRIPPMTIRMTATTRRLRLTFLPMGAIINGSENKSQYRELQPSESAAKKPKSRFMPIRRKMSYNVAIA